MSLDGFARDVARWGSLRMASEMERASASTEARSSARPGRTEDWLWIVILAAGARVFFFASGTPFFTNLDEFLHYDVVQRYRLRQSLDVFDPPPMETRRVGLRYNSPEFTSPPSFARQSAPNWTNPRFEGSPEFEAAMRVAGGFTNHEARSPPLYYASLAVWQWAGERLGVAGLSLLYWLRLPHVLGAMFLVWMAFRFTQTWFPSRPEACWSVAILIAAMPQDVFYSLNPDVLSAALYYAALHLLLAASRKAPSPATAAAAGGLAAAAVLTKVINATLLVPMALATPALLGFGRRRPERGRAVHWASASAMWLAAALPVAGWMIWNQRRLGDPTATLDRFRALGWTVQPIRDWIRHPLFTPDGAGWFLSRLTETFWRGELIWLQETVRNPWMDRFFVASSALFVSTAAAAAALRFFRPKARSDEPWGMMCAVVAVSVAALALASVRFDFGNCFYPSSEAPYIVSGRLVFGASLPFAILYVEGIRLWLAWLRIPATTIVVVSIVAVAVTLCEIAISAPMFASAFNWFAVWP